MQAKRTFLPQVHKSKAANGQRVLVVVPPLSATFSSHQRDFKDPFAEAEGSVTYSVELASTLMVMVFNKQLLTKRFCWAEQASGSPYFVSCCRTGLIKKKNADVYDVNVTPSLMSLSFTAFCLPLCNWIVQSVTFSRLAPPLSPAQGHESSQQSSSKRQE